MPQLRAILNNSITVEEALDSFDSLSFLTPSFLGQIHRIYSIKGTVFEVNVYYIIEDRYLEISYSKGSGPTWHKIKFEDIFDVVAEDVKEEMLYHLDLLK